MKSVDPPKYPQTPKNSPIYDEDQKRELRGSVYEAMNDKNPKSPSASTKELNEVLYTKWRKFLKKDELIEMGSSVERSKYFGMGSEKSVLLLTSMRRVLLIDPIKMQLRKNGDIARSSIVSCSVIDTQAFELRFVKNKMKFKCSGPKAHKWKEAFDKLA